MKVRSRFRMTLGLAGAVWWLSGWNSQAAAQAVPGPSAYAPAPHQHERVGPFRRAARHTGFFIHDRIVGDPELFDVPPLGYSLYQTMSSQVRKADLHTFTLYRSDFLAGTDQLSPSGAYRLSLLASKLPAYAGPVVIEWTPEVPPLALTRRDAVAGLLNGAGHPIGEGRVLVGPSPYPGLIGIDAANNFDTLIYRDLAAPRAYSLTPRPGFQFGGQP